MSYNIVLSNGSTLLVLGPQILDTSHCSLTLVGQNSLNYGTAYNNNLIHMMENFSAPPSSPPLLPLTGQLWFESNSRTLNLNVGTQSSPIWDSLISAGPLNSPNITMTANQFISNAVSPLPPMLVSSSVLVSNLNSQYLDGLTASVSSIANTVVARDASANIFVNVMNGVATSAEYADLAERFEASECLEPGDVVTLGGDKEIMRAGPNDFVLGVISKNPGLRMNSDAGDDESHPYVAYLGRVPVKVVGGCAKFSPLYVYEGGAATNIQGGTYVGMALEEKLTVDQGMVMAVIGR